MTSNWTGDGDLSEEQSRAIAAQVREELARRRMSRLALADLAKISISTLEKALSGRRGFTLMTAIRLEEALGVRLREEERAPVVEHGAGFAPNGLGSYSRPAMRWIEGDYLTIRPSFGEPAAIYAYRTEIRWDDTSSRMVFEERERIDAAFTQFGEVAAPHQSGHIYLVTNRQGQHRLITLSRPSIEGAMYGVLSTLQAGRGSQLIPVATAIAFVPVGRDEETPTGRLIGGDEGYARCAVYLERVKAEGYAILI